MSFSYSDLKIKLVDKWDLHTLLEHREEVWIEHLHSIGMSNSVKQDKWFELLLLDTSRQYFVIWDNTGHRIGLVRMDYIDYLNRSVRIGCDMFKDYRGIGHGKTSLKLIIKYCFDYMNMNRVWLLVLKDNHIAKSLYEKIGFIQEGVERETTFRHGKYLDSVIMSILRSEYDTNIKHTL